MRFTQGYWVIRQDYVMSYATQTVRVIKNDKELHIISACRPIRHGYTVFLASSVTPWKVLNIRLN